MDMVARVTTYRGDVGPLEDGFEQTVRVLETKAGSLGIDFLLDTRAGVGLTISFWDSPQAASDSTAWAERARDRTSAAMDLTIADVHVFDVAVRADTRASVASDA